MMLNRHLWKLLTSKRALPHSALCNNNQTRTVKTRDSTVAQREADELLDKVYHEVRAQRFSEIVVIQTKFNADPRYYILANAFNERHLLNGTEQLNHKYKQEMKLEEDEFARIGISKGWNVVDLHKIVVHLFMPECREHYDIEQLWAVGEQYDSQCRQAKSAKAQLEQQEYERRERYRILVAKKLCK